MESELSAFVIRYCYIYIVCCLLVFVPHLASYADIHCLYPKDYDNLSLEKCMNGIGRIALNRLFPQQDITLFLHTVLPINAHKRKSLPC